MKPTLISRPLLVCILLLLGSAPFGFARSQSIPAAAPNAVASPQSQNGYVLAPERAAKAIAYARARHQLYFLDLVYSVVGLLLLLRWRIAPKFRDWAERTARNRFLQACVFAPLLLLTIDLLSLPGGMIGHWLARRFGQSIQGWGPWLLDWAKGELLGLALGICLVWLLYAVVRRSPRRWWIFAWFASLPVLVFLVFVSPLVVEPLFFHFTPLATSNPALAAQLERVVGRAGQNIPVSRMYVMNASSKVNALNAYVTGLGSSERVVVWDTTIAQMTAPEIVFVFGHEMGHYVLGHIRKGIEFGAAVLLLFLFAGARVLESAIHRSGLGWGIRGVDDWASLPVLLLLVLLFDFAFTPIDNAYSRHLEHQADQYGLEVVHGILPAAPQVAAQSFQVLGEVDLEEPNPSWLVKTWFYTHPPINERIIFAHSYDPWDRGEAPEFVK